MSIVLAGGPDCFLTQPTISAAVLPALYSIFLPFLKNAIVGKPLIANLSAKPVATVASTLASLAASPELARSAAALSHSGANFLQ